ncbi:MAG: DUF5011 domain-containing protein [Tenericutes bacterium]|nr:DUF5011 domain-containing protein [Mycoplasmatota bacterium]
MKKISLIFMLLFIPLSLSSCTTIDEEDVTIILKEGIDTVEVNSEFIDSGALSKAYGFTVQNEVIYNDVDITKIGTYTIVYQIEYKNVIKTIERIVTVIDETAPVGTLNPGIDTVRVDSTWIDASVFTTDNSMEVVIVTVVGTVNTNIPGEYILIYLLEDSSGNLSQIERHVFVIK